MRMDGGGDAEAGGKQAAGAGETDDDGKSVMLMQIEPDTAGSAGGEQQ